jgi:hypothetical protein
MTQSSIGLILITRAETIGPNFKQLIVEVLSPHAKLNYRRALGLLHFQGKFPLPLLETAAAMIDDFAFRKIDQPSSEYLYTLVDSRYGSKSMILTSNRAISDWMGIFPDPVIAGAILDRLSHQAHQIQLKGESMRKKLAQKNPT